VSDLKAVTDTGAVYRAECPSPLFHSTL